MNSVPPCASSSAPIFGLPAVAALDAEQFDFHPLRRDRGGVDHDERASPAPNGRGWCAPQFLAGAGGADDEDAAVGRRDLLDRLAQLIDGGRASDQRRGRRRVLLELLTSRLNREFSSARSATSTSRSALNGFSMKS